MENKTEKLVVYALLIAVSMILSYVEALIPVNAGIPGIKMGLANIAVVFALYRLGDGAAVVISVIRVVLVGFTFGSVASMMYAMSGAAVSLLVMILMKKSDRFSVKGVSVSGGVAHNMAQIAVAAAVMGTKKIMFYLPVLILSGTFAGLLIGIASSLLVDRITLR